MTHPAWIATFADESNRIEGMPAASIAEVGALERFLSSATMSVERIEEYVASVAPGHVLRRHANMNVRVGNHVAPAGGESIEPQLRDLLAGIASSTPYHTHLAYETLHPFTDGNGRSGRALWLWHHMRRGSAARPQKLGFLHTFYYEALEFSGDPIPTMPVIRRYARRLLNDCDRMYDSWVDASVAPQLVDNAITRQPSDMHEGKP